MPELGVRGDPGEEALAQPAPEGALRAAEGHGIAVEHVDDHYDRRDRRALHQDREHVLRPHQPAVEERQARQDHEENEQRGGQHPGGVARVDVGDDLGHDLGFGRLLGQRRTGRGGSGRKGAGEPGQRVEQSHRVVSLRCCPGAADHDVDHRASSPVSPVRTLRACSTERTKILPSPIFPVFAVAASGLDHLLGHRIGDHELELHLRHEVHHVLGAAVDLGVARLPPVSLHLRNHQALDAEGGQRLADLLELEGLDHGNDQLHEVPRLLLSVTRAASKFVMQVPCHATGGRIGH